jgi:hypothetical protein
MKNIPKKLWEAYYTEIIVGVALAFGSFILSKLSGYIGFQAENYGEIIEATIKIAEYQYFWLGLAFVFVGGRLICKLIIEIKNKLLKLSQLEGFMQSVGLMSFRPHNNEKEKDWSSYVDLLNSTSDTQLSILGAAGYETFSSVNSPLHNYLNQTNAEIRILLLNPDSKFFKHRCVNVGVNETKYSGWIYDSIDYCKKLKIEKNKAIELRLYDDYPIWKMVFSPEYMWLQHYQKEKHVKDVHVYFFQTGSSSLGRTSLYYPLTSVFRRRWENGFNVDLETWTRPQLQTKKSKK